MCGIAGYINFNNQPVSKFQAIWPAAGAPGKKPSLQTADDFGCALPPAQIR